MARCDSPYPSDFHDGVQKDNGSTGLEYEVLCLQTVFTHSTKQCMFKSCLICVSSEVILI